MEDKLALAISLIFNLIFLSIPFESVASQSSISGSELSSLITKHLNTLGLEGNPSINNKRIFSGCRSEDIVIQKRDASWKTIQLSCKGNPHWTYNFRNAMDRAKEELIFNSKRIAKKTASVKKINVFVLVKNKSKGETIRESDLAISAANSLLTKGAFEDSQSLLGKTLKRSLKKGTILKKNHLNPAWLVYKNQKIIIEHNLGEVSIKMEGIALKNGAIGDRITVRNTSSNKTLEGFVNGEKKISIFRKIY